MRHGSCILSSIMKVAIPISDGRISPLFDSARRLLLVTIENRREVWRSEQVVEQSERIARTRRVTELDADVLICGAISRELEAMLTSAAVEVIPLTCGMVEDVLQAFISGRLTEEAFVMPGCHGNRRQYRGDHRARSGDRHSHTMKK